MSSAARRSLIDQTYVADTEANLESATVKALGAHGAATTTRSMGGSEKLVELCT